MGADIHMTIEAEVPWYDRNGDHEWQEVRMVWVDEYWLHALRGNPANAAAKRWAYSLRPHIARNYQLFAALGDVRNGYGFAGVDTGGRIEPCVGAMRGLPDDIDPRYETWAHGDHSFGWATLEELLAYDWDREITLRGVITEENYLEGSWRDGGPDTYSGGISGLDIVTYTEDEYETADKRLDRKVYVQVEWTTELSAVTSDFTARLKEIGERIPLPHDRIRLVYGFDS